MMKMLAHLILLFACLSFLSISLQTIKFDDWSELASLYIHKELSPDVTHHDIDKGVLDEREEDEEGAGGHEHVNCLLKKNARGYKHVNCLLKKIKKSHKSGMTLI